MANGFHVVAVRIEDEGAVVVRMIDGADAGRSVILPTRRHGCFVKRPHLLTVGGQKGDVDRSGWFITSSEPKFGLRGPTESGPTVDFGHECDAKRRERRTVEVFASLVVRHTQRDV